MIGLDNDEFGLGAEGTERIRNETLITMRLSLDNEREVNLPNGENRRMRGFEEDLVGTL